MTARPRSAVPTGPRRRRSSLSRTLLADRVSVSASVLLACIAGLSLAAPWLAPQDPYDLSELLLQNAELPPVWLPGGRWPYVLGTDLQGRDLGSAILYGTRTSVAIGVASVALSLGLGTVVGIAAGYLGGWLDRAVRGLGDVLLSFPTLLIAVLMSAALSYVAPSPDLAAWHGLLVVLAISFSTWIQFARTARSMVLRERETAYVVAARALNASTARILYRHVLPNVSTSLVVMATLHVGLAIVSEATLSFLGFGMPPETPSLGMLLRNGSDYMFSGAWWLIVWPATVLGLVVLCVNLLGDRLRDAWDPRYQ